MQIVVAMDSFKGSLTSMEAGNTAAAGIHRAFPGAQIQVCPLADGGEGTAEALTRGMGGRLRQCAVTGPLGDTVLCTYGIAGRTAVIEVAGAAGLTLLPEEKRDPRYTTTYGVGQLIRDALQQGCRRFIIGLGGSATNDGGAGMLQALGFDLLDADNAPIPPGAAGLEKLRCIGLQQESTELEACSFRVACDVTNPLCGPRGCSAVYGPQKGATPEMVQEMDDWLAHYARCAAAAVPAANPNAPGAGAAGGLGFAFQTFLGASLEPGAEIVLQETGLEERIRQADVVVTGEGCLDGQTAMGKGPAAVARLAKQYGKPVIALAGCVTAEARSAVDFDAYFPILRGACTLEAAMAPETAVANLADAAEQVFRLIRRFRTERDFRMEI